MFLTYRPFLLAALICVCGCATLMPFGNSLAKATNNAELKREVRDIVPFGTSVTQAAIQMKLRGFKCEVERNTSFAERSWTGDIKNSTDGIDILRCKRCENAGDPMVKIYDIAFVLDGDVVKDVLACHYLDAR